MPSDVKYLATKMIGVNLISVFKTLMFKHTGSIFLCNGGYVTGIDYSLILKLVISNLANVMK